MQKPFFILFFIASFNCFSQNFAKNALLKNGIAVSGYDVTSYFSGEPIKGKMSFKTSFEGAVFLFSTKTNLDLFNAEPKKYLPQYGGWCAYAMGHEGEKVEVNPETFKIIGGKLYLFYNKFFNNTLSDWNKDETKLKKAADMNWQKINK
jgi:YHS domain-containing protein